MHYDILIIGSGLAGLCAAAAASEAGAKVAVIDKGAIGLGSNSAMAHAYFTTPTADFPSDAYIKETLHTGRGINRISRVHKIANEVPAALAMAQKRLKLEFVPGQNNYHVAAEKPDQINGVAMMKQAAAAVKQLPGVHILAGRQVTRILSRDGRACGVLALNKDGSWQIITAGSLILASGGFGAIYKHNDNMRSSLGQGCYLAAQAGLDLWDMEFVQFYPVVMHHPGLPMSMVYPGYPKGVTLTNAAGEDLLAKYGVPDLSQAILRLRDKLSAALFKETSTGPVMLDFSQVKAGWNVKPLSLLTRLKYDFKHKPFGVMPGAHFTMGGLRVDDDGNTGLPGLLACGEVAWGLHGANRRGGNALTECLVSGRLTGRAAAQQAGINTAEAIGLSEALPPSLAPDRGDLAPARAFLTKLRNSAWHRAGIVRDADGMAAGLQEASAMRGEAERLPAVTVNQYLARENARAAVFCLSAVLAAGQGRLESRGAFMREDYPQTGGGDWLVNSRLAYDPESSGFKVEYVPLENS